MEPQNPRPPPRNENDDKPKFAMRTIFLWLLLLIGFLVMFNLFQGGRESVETIDYNPNFVQWVEQGKIRRCEIVTEIAGAQFIRGEMTELDTKTGKPRKFKVDIVVTDGLPAWLKENGVPFSFNRQRVDVWQLVQGAVPILLFVGLLYFLFLRQMRAVGHGAMSFGKSRARLLARDRTKITFQEVAGINEAKEEVQEIVEFLKDPKKFQTLGGRIPKGVLLMGPPGTGKTLLAKAIAGEADVPFFSISGSDFVEMFVGVGASRVRDMFEQGKKNAPCIVFIDEIDAVGRSRFSGIGGGHDEREQTLNALLVEMDGFETQDGVIIIAATNRPDVLDPALLRPGRFDRQIVIDLPVLEGREEILKIHARKIKLASNADLKRLARGTSGFSGADLANLLNEAALLAARQGKVGVDMQALEEARDKVRWGREHRSRVLDDDEKKLTAYHEAGHALVLQLVEKSEPLHKITIIPRGTAYLGATMQLPEKDRYTEGLLKLKGMLAGLMGGRVAEEMVLGDISTGAGNDLKQATHLARLMVCNWGMSQEMGPQTFGAQEELLFLGREVARSHDFSEETSRRIDQEVNKLLRESYESARGILQMYRAQLDLIAGLLVERETLDGQDIEDIVKCGHILTEEERAPADPNQGQKSEKVLASAKESVPSEAPAPVSGQAQIA
ncbi:MAG: ATP-dependent zinc metalloprotease FtsH [Kiritimatiellae bacterium]|nr:ATP-dependent zinc metalloprotease FtsH [Kiritimatiellia bacterium]